MSVGNQLLSRDELIGLWREIASSFNSELELTVDNSTSLAMKFVFQNDYGQTHVGIKDLAGSGITAGSTFESYVITKLTVPSSERLGITLPPLFSGLLERLRTDVSPFYLKGTKYWVKSQSTSLREAVSDKKIKGLAHFDSLYLKTMENELILKSHSFMGKAHQIHALINLHLRFLKLISKQ